MDIFPQITVALKPESNQSGLNTSSFKPGSTHTLTVLEISGGRALIDFGNFRASADIRIPVTVGDELRVKVQESGKQLKLALLNTTHPKIGTNDSLTQPIQNSDSENYNKIQTDLKQILSQFLDSQRAQTLPKPILNVLNTLASHFEALDLEKIITDVALRLKSTVDNSGIFFEKILEHVISKLLDEPDTPLPKQLAQHPDIQAILSRDLKAALLTLKNFADAETLLQKAFDVRSLAALHKAIDFLLADITSQQGRAVSRMDSANPFQVLTFALPLAAEKQAAKLKIYYQKKQKNGSKNGFQISLLLSMDRLGDLRVDFYHLDKDLTATFFVKDQSIQSKIQENFSALPEILDPFFNQILLRVIVSEKKINNFDHEDIQLTGDRRVDLRI